MKDLPIIGANKTEDGKEKTPIGLEAMCWTCEKVWNVTLLPVDAKGVKCSCGGFVVTETGKIMSRPIFDEYESKAPLLGEDEFQGGKGKIILLSDD